MTHKFCETGNLTVVLTVVFTLLILTAGHTMAREDNEKEEILVGSRLYSEVMSDRLHPLSGFACGLLTYQACWVRSLS